MESKTENVSGFKRGICIALTLCLVFISLCGCSGGDLKDGTYKAYVTLEGGSGKASIASPCDVEVKNGEKTATVTWSSKHYDYMIVNEKKYYPVNKSGNSTFEIPVDNFDEPMKVIADTTAMSEPHEIEYELTFSLEKQESFGGEKTAKKQNDLDTPPTISGLNTPEIRQNKYATEFNIYEYENGYRAVATTDGTYFLNIEDKGEEKVLEAAEEAGCKVLENPPQKIYLAATAAMSLIVSADSLKMVSYSSVSEKSWNIPEAKEAMKSGAIQYAGKYSAPDYEMLLAGNCDLAVESTMILHTPKVADKLETLGINVFIDRASFEAHPMGRLEWIQVYGTLCGNENAAETFFENECEKYDELMGRIEGIEGEVGICFFYVNSQGQIVTRYSGDYIPTMIEMAGGTYLPKDLTKDDDESRSGSVTVSLEDFYDKAKDADILIYNGTIASPLKGVDELIEMDGIFSEFRAVENNRVYTSDSSLYQATADTVDIMGDFYSMISGEGNMNFFTKVD